MITTEHINNKNADIEQDNIFMQLALKQARLAMDDKEVPVGAVIVCDGEVIAVGRNRREGAKNALAHAEIEAINNACVKLGGWRLHRCTMYVTLEPCPMCAGAIINSRMARLVFGANEERVGAFGSIINMNALPLSYSCELTSGICADECRELMQSFFLSLRSKT